jgi:hypothetical protein
LRKLLAATIGVLALAVTGAAAAGPQIGFAEDGTKYAEDGGARLYDEMNQILATSNRVAVFWDGTQTIADQPFLDRMIPVAKAHNIQVVFAIYPQKATLAPTTADAASSFCDYAVKVMQRYPYVRKVIIGNEPNQPKFWQPIWNGSQPASPAAMEVVLASCYDKLKAFDPTLDVTGASSNSSISPVRYLNALGDAYRRSGRTAPLFDELSWHCYPNVNTDEVETGYAWPNTGCVNAARVKLALWDAFHGTGQPTLPGYPVTTTGQTLFGDTARMFIDETGWQVDTTGRPGYVNNENVPPVSEEKQAQNYEKLVHLADCESTLTDFHIFHEVDEADRTGFQSAVLHVDFSERPSATSLRDAIGADDGQCSGAPWQTLGSFLYSTSAVVPVYRTFPYAGAQPFAAKTTSGGGVYVQLTAGEGFTYTITFKNGSQTKTASGSAPRTTATVKAPAGFGAGTATIVLKAETNPSRTSTVTLNLGGKPQATKKKKRR